MLLDVDPARIDHPKRVLAAGDRIQRLRLA